MGTYDPYSDRPEMPPLSKRLKGHPVWGAIGILMAIILPIVAYAAAEISFASPKVRGLLGLPSSAYKPISVFGIGVPQGVIWLTIGYLLVFYALYALAYALVYSSMGLTPYTPLDVKRAPKLRRRRRWGEKFIKIAAVFGVLIAAAGSYFLVQLDLARGWVAIPTKWYVPGPVPLAGVYVFLFLLILAFLWTLAALFSALVSAVLSHSPEDTEY